jgi:hypothetical protein
MATVADDFPVIYRHELPGHSVTRRRTSDTAQDRLGHRLPSTLKLECVFPASNSCLIYR